jgi:hypothetical protein
MKLSFNQDISLKSHNINIVLTDYVSIMNRLNMHVYKLM